MVGGTVVEVAEIKTRPDALWVNCGQIAYTRLETCAILVQKNSDSLRIQVGDSVWWHGRSAMWTPAGNRVSDEEAKQLGLKCGRDWDIKIPRIGYSGITYEAALLSPTQ